MTDIRKHWGWLIAILAVGGCSPKPAAAPAPIVSTTATPTPRAATNNLSVGSDIAGACKITVTDVANAPKFDFESSELTSEDRAVLAQIAKCVTTGPLRGRALKVVGRTDARGEPEYNLGLGGHRAASTKLYLSQLGVDRQKIVETSRGELDATGTTEDGWRRDRRVDVLLQ